MPLRELNRGPPVQRAPDLFAGAMFGEPEIPDAHYDIEPVTRSLHLPRLGARRAVHGPPKRARRVATTEAEVGHVRRASQELDRLGPHAVAVLQRGATVQAVGDFRAIAEVGQGPERARRLHRRLLSPPAAQPHGRRGWHAWPGRLVCHTYPYAASSAATGKKPAPTGRAGVGRALD